MQPVCRSQGWMAQEGWSVLRALRSLSFPTYVLLIWSVCVDVSGSQTVVFIDPPTSDRAAQDKFSCNFVILREETADRSFLTCFADAVKAEVEPDMSYTIDLKYEWNFSPRAFDFVKDPFPVFDKKSQNQLELMELICGKTNCPAIPGRYRKSVQRLLEGEKPRLSGDLFSGAGIMGSKYQGMRMFLMDDEAGKVGIIVRTDQIGNISGYDIDIFFFNESGMISHG